MLNNNQISYMAQKSDIFETAYVTGNYENLHLLEQGIVFKSLFGEQTANEVYNQYTQLINEGIEKMILKCNCKHCFQDERYGASMRVHNKAIKASTSDQHAYRCTVCSKVQMVKVK